MIVFSKVRGGAFYAKEQNPEMRKEKAGKEGSGKILKERFVLGRSKS